MKEGTGSPHRKLTLPLRVTVLHGDLVEFETGNRLQLRRSHGLFEGVSTAPFPIGSDGHQLVMHGVLMHIMQSRQITPLMREVCVTEVLPQSSAPRLVFSAIQFLRR